MKFKDLSKYTIAENCSDLTDLHEGEKEIKEYLNYCYDNKIKPCKTAYIRLWRLGNKVVSEKIKRIKKQK